MPFSTPNPVSEYNRQLLKMTEWHQYQINRTVTYTFHFEGADDFNVVERSYLMKDAEIERIWNDLAEMNSRHFVRKDLEIRYPSCLLSGADVCQ